MQNIQERLTGLWPATGASSKRIFKKSRIFRALSCIFFQKLNMSGFSHTEHTLTSLRYRNFARGGGGPSQTARKQP